MLMYLFTKYQQKPLCFGTQIVSDYQDANIKILLGVQV